ncbi:hypothetical protein V5N11_016210 [Cardamine amara subsp. amara]|uniref:Uncharacterized protein n=1 Tax=Cardamine amara subsp. amara TaxID=228776 RepID=A0ABD1BVB8_CARAN
MATNTSKFLCILFSPTFVVQGYGKCNIQKNVGITQELAWTGGHNVSDRSSTWQTVITNKCPCMLGMIKLSCRGFKSSAPVDSSKMKKSGDECLINGGHPLLPLQGFTFYHTGKMQFNFTILSATILDCANCI